MPNRGIVSAVPLHLQKQLRETKRKRREIVILTIMAVLNPMWEIPRQPDLYQRAWLAVKKHSLP
jgi:hypothetical protein